MQIRETITLTGKEITEPLPKPAETLVEFFNKNGYKFKNLGDETLLLNELFSIDKFNRFKSLIEKTGLELKIDHSIWTEYEDKDFKENPLWILFFPDIWIGEIDFEKSCKTCHKKTTVIDLNKKVTHVKSKKPIVSVNGQFTIVKKELKKKIEEELPGARLEPFDEHEDYFHLLAKSSLGGLINTPDDFLEYRGICQECNLPVYEMFFSSMKYKRSNWNGDDIVSGAFHEGVLFTEKAYNLLKSTEKEIIKYGVVILQ